jgi:hypothetical protein
LKDSGIEELVTFLFFITVDVLRLGLGFSFFVFILACHHHVAIPTQTSGSEVVE